MKVFIATPAYDGRVCDGYTQALKASMAHLAELGIGCQWETLDGCCYVQIARNKLVRTFLESDCTDLVFIDADVEWTPDGLVDLLSHPAQIVSGAYPTKEHDERYPVWLKTGEAGRPELAGLSGLLECWQAATGFMRIHRSAFLAMQKHFGEELEVDEYDFTGSKKTGGFSNFFDTSKRGRVWIGEDVAFCRAWTMEMGRPMFIDPGIKLTHWGTWPSGHPRAFRGDYHDYLSRLPGGANDPGYQGTDIPGYLRKKEAQWLFKTAQHMTSIVELGSFCGKSAHALMSGCLGPVTCVDTWKAMDWYDAETKQGVKDDDALAEERFRMFLANTAGFSGRRVLRMPSVEAASQFPDRSVDMVFIDADHSREAVLADIEAWLPKCRKLLCGHDYEEWGWPAVKRAVDDRFGDRVKTVDTIWYVELE